MTTVQSVIDDLLRLKRVDGLLLANVASGCKKYPYSIQLQTETADFLVASLCGAHERLGTYPHAHSKEALLIATWINSLC